MTWHGSFMAHGMCYLWARWMIEWQVAADLGIALAYCLIPIFLAQLTRERWVSSHPVVWWFIAFISLCGMTHLIDIVTIWQPMYVVQAVVKTATAIVSLITVVQLWQALSRVLRTVDAALDTHDTGAIYRLLTQWRSKAAA